MRPPRLAHDEGRSSSFAHKFALYCCAGSLISILAIAAIVHVADHVDVGSSDLRSGSMTSFASAGGDVITRGRRGRRLETVEGSKPCGDIFLNVQRSNFLHKKDENNSTINHINANEATDCNYKLRLCQYAKSCDGDFPSQPLLPFILCHGIRTDDVSTQRSKNLHYHLTSIFIYGVLPVILLVYLLLLFRLLATTADSYFSPALESFSFELGLPPRFAGATLLALGNGSPDLGSTIHSILLWNEDSANDAVLGGRKEQEWTMGLGSLTGGGMFVGTIVCGLLVRSCSGISCRWSFLRDVTMYAASVSVVWAILASGSVSTNDVRLFLGMYASYVTIIFCSDMYHRRVTLSRLKRETKERRQSMKEWSARRLSQLMEKSGDNNCPVGEGTPLMVDPHQSYGEEKTDRLRTEASLVNGEADNRAPGEGMANLPSFESFSSGSNASTRNHIPQRPRLSIVDRFAMITSNYDSKSVKFLKLDLSSRLSADSEDDSADMEWNEIANALHEALPGIHRSPSDIEEQPTEQPMPFSSQTDLSIIAEAKETRSWSKSFHDAFEELKFRFHNFLRISFEGETSFVEKTCLFIELPFVAMRTITTPVPCEEHYCQPIVALSVALSPYWVVYYLGTHSVTIPWVAVYCLLSLTIALAVLRYAGEEKLPLAASIPISLYGFFIAATYIDTIAAYLVALLQFLGTVSRIPPTILGATVLAWGNSLGDLSANLALARKGMPDMATTGCFAGPSFNLLVGTGLGFLALQHELQQPSISPVSLTPGISTGFSFIVLNCCSIILCSGICFKWRLPFGYCYVLFSLYFLFIARSVLLLFD